MTACLLSRRRLGQEHDARARNAPSRQSAVENRSWFTTAIAAFCKLWIARWRETTAGAVDYEPLQEVAARFPEVPRAEFERAVKLIETDGQVFSGAEAVFRSLGAGRRNNFWRWCFDHDPGLCARFRRPPTDSSRGTASWRIA